MCAMAAKSHKGNTMQQIQRGKQRPSQYAGDRSNVVVLYANRCLELTERVRLNTNNEDAKL